MVLSLIADSHCTSAVVVKAPVAEPSEDRLDTVLRLLHFLKDTSLIMIYGRLIDSINKSRNVLYCPKNVVKGCVTKTATHATFDYVNFDSKVILN